MLRCIALYQLVLLLSAGLTGCGAYRLEGKVVPGPQSRVEVVTPDHPQLNQAGIEDAQIEITVDPRSLSPRVLTEFQSQPDGTFSIPVDEFGAGFLEYELGMRVTREGFNDLWQMIEMPGRNRLLLITLAPGRARVTPPQDIIEETLEAGKQFE